MRIVIAPDSFKGTATADEIADAIAAGWLSARPDDTIVRLPMADGGEGTLDAFQSAIPDAIRQPLVVRGPDGRPVQSSWLALPDGRAVVELAASSGLPLLTEPHPDSASTIGFGQTIAAALDAGATGLLLGIGGSASTDGGLGLLLALGLRVHPAEAVEHAHGGDGLDRIIGVETAGLRALPPGGAVVLTDVDAPLTGERGAAAVFGPQKGVTADRVPVHDARLARWAARFPGVDHAAPGAGAAGGAGFGLMVWGATLARGAAMVADLLDLPERIIGADLVITGEGRFDAQSGTGKTPGLVAELAHRAGVPVAIVAGTIGGDTGLFWRAVGLADLAAAAPGGTVHLTSAADIGHADAMRRPEHWARVAGARLAASAGPARRRTPTPR